MQSKDYYDILGISRSATKQVCGWGGRRGGRKEGKDEEGKRRPLFGPFLCEAAKISGVCGAVVTCA